MKKTKIIMKCLAFIFVFIHGYSSAQNRVINGEYNKEMATINDSLDIVIFFNDEGNVQTIILKNKKNGTSNIYGYNNNGITPVLSGKEVNGQRDGLYLTFYSNGFLNTRSIYSGGKLDGCSEIFSEDGKVIYKALYEKGIEKKVEIQDSTTFEPKIMEIQQ